MCYVYTNVLIYTDVMFQESKQAADRWRSLSDADKQVILLYVSYKPIISYIGSLVANNNTSDLLLIPSTRTLQPYLEEIERQRVEYEARLSDMGITTTELGALKKKLLRQPSKAKTRNANVSFLLLLLLE